MADPLTPNIQLAVPTRGADPGTWDVPINGDMEVIDSCLGGVTTKALSNTNISLTITEAQANVLRFTGALTANIEVTLPAIVKGWSAQNLCTGNFYVRINNGIGNAVCVPPGGNISIINDGTNIEYSNLGLVGGYLDLAVSTVPSWISNCTVAPYLNCDGGSFSGGTYPALAALLGSTTLPDLRGRSRAYMNGGTGRITTSGSGIDGNTIFSSGGVESVTLITSQIPSHTHTANVTDPGHAHTGTAPVSPAYSGTGSGGVTQVGGNVSLVINSAITGISVANSSTGGDGSHTNMNPVQISGITLIRAA